jgi:perosamine synthetase
VPMTSISLASPSIGIREMFGVFRVLMSGNLAQGPQVAVFEKEFSEFVSGRTCVAVNSGTSALHLSLLALGIGPGDEVIVPSFTFAASANAIALTGAKPIFIDIDPNTFNINPELLSNLINPSTKAIMVVHLYGNPAPMKEIMEIANSSNLFVIEDAAQAHAASIDNQPIGTFGHAAIFSFYPTKNMTTGEGGMIVLADDNHARVCRLYRNQGMEKRYQNEIVGFNLRMTDIAAAIGRVQLRKLSKFTKARIDNAAYLNRALEIEHLPIPQNGSKHVYHQYTIRIKEKRDELVKHLEHRGIQSGVYYPTAVHRLPAFNVPLELVETMKATQEVVSIPVHPKLKKRDLKRIADCINEFMKL